MKAFMRGASALLLCAAGLSAAVAQDRTVLNSDRDKVSYAIGLDVASSIKPVAPDLDLVAFEQAIQRAFAGGGPAMRQEDARATDAALRATARPRRARHQDSNRLRWTGPASGNWWAE